MNRWDWMRIAGASGLLAVALAIAGFAFFQFPALDDGPEKIRADYAADRDGAITMSILSGLSVMAFLVFVGAVTAAVREGEGGAQLFAEVAFGGGLITAGTMLVGAGAGFLLAFRTATITGDGTLMALADGQKIALAVSVFPMAVFIAATSAGILRTHIVDAWVGWAGLAATAVWLSGLPQLYVVDGFWAFDGAWGYVTGIVMALWVALLSLTLVVPRLAHYEHPRMAAPMAHA